MNWFENKTTQIIALVGIVSTLAGFGYQGAQYVNEIKTDIATIKADLDSLEKTIDKLQTGNPLAG